MVLCVLPALGSAISTVFDKRTTKHMLAHMPASSIEFRHHIGELS